MLLTLTNTLGYNSEEFIMTIKKFILQVPGENPINNIWSQFKHSFCKLYLYGATRKIVSKNEMAQITTKRVGTFHVNFLIGYPSG